MTFASPASDRHLPRGLVRLTVVLSLILVSGTAHAQRNPELSSEEQLKGEQVRAAFRDVVASASRSTVEIWCGDVQVAVGTIVTSEGHILTKASELLLEPVCRLHDGDALAATLVAIDRKFDLALLKVDRSGLAPIEWADGDLADVGRWLATPGKDELPIAVGVVGVGELKVPPQRGQGILGIADMDEIQRGPRILKINPLSSASRFGLQNGDVILQVADKFVKDKNSLKDCLRDCRPGDSLFLRILRGESVLMMQVTLDGEFTDSIERQGIQNRMGGNLSIRRAGFERVLQHDTVLRPYQCGGVVVDLSGKAVGLNIARAGRTETFALPVSVVKGRIEKLLAGEFNIDYATPGELLNAPAVEASEKPTVSDAGGAPRRDPAGDRVNR